MNKIRLKQKKSINQYYQQLIYLKVIDNCKIEY